MTEAAFREAVTLANLQCRLLEMEADVFMPPTENETRLERWQRIMLYASRTYPGPRSGTVALPGRETILARIAGGQRQEAAR